MLDRLLLGCNLTHNMGREGLGGRGTLISEGVDEEGQLRMCLVEVGLHLLDLRYHRCQLVPR
jgi:hypothetical protein